LPVDKRVACTWSVRFPYCIRRPRPSTRCSRIGVISNCAASWIMTRSRGEATSRRGNRHRRLLPWRTTNEVGDQIMPRVTGRLLRNAETVRPSWAGLDRGLWLLTRSPRSEMPRRTSKELTCPRELSNSPCLHLTAESESVEFTCTPDGSNAVPPCKYGRFEYGGLPVAS